MTYLTDLLEARKKMEDNKLCKICDHPKGYHHIDGKYDNCMANEDTCDCSGFKDSKVMSSKVAISILDTLIKKAKEKELDDVENPLLPPSKTELDWVSFGIEKKLSYFSAAKPTKEGNGV